MDTSRLQRSENVSSAVPTDRAPYRKCRCSRPIGLTAFVLITLGAAPGYEEDLRPLLKRRCLACHGEQSELAGGLDLRLRRTTVAGGDTGAAVVPGDADSSLLIDLVASGEMPPGDARKLTEVEVDLLRAWIDAGAKTDRPEPEQMPPPGEPFFTAADRDHWSLRPIVRPATGSHSDMADAAGIRADTGSVGHVADNRIDAFIAAKLHENGLGFSPEADRRTLIRRLYFDLLGLPPSPEEVVRFLNDDAPDAWQQLVDRVLASPHYGERWARHWLDVVHFGETHGYDKDKPRPNAWPYRDYVIRAFNEDKPYGRFVQEQVAGDVLFANTRDGVESLGFIAAGPWDFIGHKEVPETKIDGMIARHLDRDDMVQNTLTTFCSLTVGCAQCHDHKFDPIPKADYYALQAVFAALDRTDREYDADPATAARRSEFLAEQRRLQQRSGDVASAIERLGGEELKSIRVEIASAKKPGERPPEYGYHSAIESSSDIEKWVQIDLGEPCEVHRIRLFACDDDFNSIGAGFGFPPQFRIESCDDPSFESGVTVLVDATSDDVTNPKLEPLEFELEPQPIRHLRITATQLAHRKSDYIFALAELELIGGEGANLARGAEVTSLDSIEAPVRWRKTNLVDGLKPRPTTDPQRLAALRAQEQELLAERVPPTLLSEQQEIASAQHRVMGELAELPPPLVAYVGAVHHGSGNFRGTGPDGGQPRTITVLHRGDVTRPGREAHPGALSCLDFAAPRFDLPADAAEGDRRAALARWLTHRDNPLTWRSIVNRVWQYHFGRGLVETPSDFGRMGATPTHPALLDWLAVEFRGGDQSLKDLHRLIVTSRTWRQASRIDDPPRLQRGLAVDAENRLLWRMPRRQLEAEAVRDAMLVAAGRLNREMGGPSFQDFVIDKPQHSPHYEYHLHDPNDSTSHRRAVYRFLVRSQTQPFMTVLGCADPSMMVARRSQTVSPLQALTLLNSGLSLTMSRHFADRLRAERGELSDQISRGVELTLQRSATREERDALTRYAESHGLEQTCRVLVNLSEFLFVD